MNGSSCPTCGWVLRWLPEQGAWGCDRCRKVLPASQVAPPQQPPQPPPGGPFGAPPQPPPGGPFGAPPQPPPGGPFGAPPQPPPGGPFAPHAMPPGPGYPMPPPGGPRSSRGLVIGLGVGAVVVAGAIVAVVLATRGGGDGGGASSREDLVKRALAAMGEGDVEKLVKLSDPVGLYGMALDCSERDKATQAKDKDAADGDDPDKDAAEPDDVDDDPQIMEKRIRRQHEKLVEKTKGMKIELISLVEDKKDKKGKEGKEGDAGGEGERRKGTKKGDEATKGCVLKVDLEFLEVVAKVRVTEAEGKEPSEQEAKLMAIHAGDSWFLMMAPQLHAGAGAIGAKLRAYRDQLCACKDAACADGVQQEAKAWGKTVRADAKRLPEDEQKALEAIDDEMTACRRKLGGGGEGGEGLEMKEAVAKMEEIKAKMCACADRACVERVQKELESWGASMKGDGDEKVRGFSKESMDKYSELMKGYIDCMNKVMAADPAALDQLPPEDPPPSAGSSSAGGASLASLPACAEYRRQIDKIRACPKYPPTAADAIRRGYEQMEKSWAGMRPTPATRDSMNQACETIVSSLKDALAQLCP